VDFFNDFNNLLGPIISLGITLSILGGFGLWLKKLVNNGMVSNEEFSLTIDNPEKGTGLKQLIEKAEQKAELYADKKIADHKAQTTKDDEADRKWLNELQNKVEANGKHVYKIAGKIGIDL
jgi:hypothetical protein